jgi:hypothetical protein
MVRGFVLGGEFDFELFFALSLILSSSLIFLRFAAFRATCWFYDFSFF